MFFLWLEISNIFTKNYGKEVYNLVQSTGAQEERIGTVGEIFSIKKQRDLTSSYMAVQNKVWEV